jgi:acetyltransferase-like isoleucine patch superfamily enzyme
VSTLPAIPPRTSVPAQVRRFLGTLGGRQVLTVWLEQWLGGLVRPIPSFVGFALRYALYRLLFARLDGFCFIYAGAHLSHTYGIRAGRNLHVNGGAFFDGRGGLTIGSNVLVGPNAVLLSSQHHWSDPSLPIVLQGHRLAPTTIGDDVWIGANVVVTPGVTLATGTVVGAGSVVTTDTAPYTIVAGVPARPIGDRPRPA